jgi:glycosyltransferase involved in cell wall biosynthesis
MKKAQQRAASEVSQVEAAASPRVTVVIPAYNAAAFIAEALDSVFAQSCQDFEVIVINDGSPDTAELERVLHPYLARITCLRQPNLGPSAARNAGIRQARGEFVAFLDSDDTWDPEFLNSQLRLIESGTGVDLVYADLRIVGDSSRAGETFMEGAPSRGPATFDRILAGDCQPSTSAALARRQAVIQAGMFDESFWRVEDFDLWLRLAWRGGVLYQREVLGSHRMRSGSLSADPEIMQQTAARVLTKLERELKLSPNQQAALRRRRAHFEARADLLTAKRLLAQGETSQARECLKKANASSRRVKITAAILALKLAPDLTRRVVALWDGVLRARSRGYARLRRIRRQPS